MANFIAFNRDQAFLLPPDMKAWLPEDDLAHLWLRQLSGCRSGHSKSLLGPEASRNTIHG